MNFRKVKIVYKETPYEKHFLGRKGERLQKKLGRSHPASHGLQKAHEEHHRTLKAVVALIKKSGLPYSLEKSQRVSKSLKAYDLIITVGGDGTLLRSSHWVDLQPVLAINSAPSQSVGALCRLNLKTLPAKLRAVLKGDFKVHKLNRLQILVNGKPIAYPALNDVLYANNCPAGTSRYLLKAKAGREDQKSSGVWIATASGSTAAIHAAGGSILPVASQKIQYLVREPYQGGPKRYRLIRGILNPGQSLQIINKIPEASLFIDGMQGLKSLRLGDIIVFKSHKIPLSVIL